MGTVEKQNIDKLMVLKVLGLSKESISTEKDFLIYSGLYILHTIS
jgi:hypothetical protein